MNTDLLLSPPDNTAETVAFDLEGTLTTGIGWQGMRDYLIEQGQERAYKRFFIRRMPRYFLFRLGVVDLSTMKEDWILNLLRLFAGYTAGQMAEMGSWVVEHELWPARRPVVVEELLAHQKRGCRVIISTGTFEPILARFLMKLDGVEGLGTPLSYEDGQCTGFISGRLNVENRKAEQLEPFSRNGRIHSAYGDTGQDLAMLRASELPVAVFPDKTLRREAETNGWRILEEK